MAIECSFGVLIRRWGLFWRALSVKMNRRSGLIGAAMKLHNFCIVEKISVPEYRVDKDGLSEINHEVWRKASNFGLDGEPNDYLDRHDESRRRASTDRNAIRDELVKDLEEAGLKRPGTNSFHRQVTF
jgi:hypothetical protein